MIAALSLVVTLAGSSVTAQAGGAARPVTAQAEKLAQEAVSTAQQGAAALQKARRALALTAEFVPTEFVTAGRKGELVEDEFKAARDAYQRHRAALYDAAGTIQSRQGQPLAASRYQRRALLLDPTPERGLALARSLNELGRGREALHTVERAIAGLASLTPEAAAVIARACDVAGLPSAQAEIDRGRLTAAVGAALALREGPFELPAGVRLSTSPIFRLEGVELTVIYSAEASCRSCSSDLEELARQLPKGARVLALPPGDDQDQALRQVLQLYRRPWPLLLGRDLAARLSLAPRSLLLVARGGWTQAVLKAPFGQELGVALAALLRKDVQETIPRAGWNRRPVDRSAPPSPPALLPEGLAPGEDAPFPPEFDAAVAAFRAGRASEAQRLFDALEAKGDGWLLPPEARLNRALCLARAGQRDAARRILLRTGDSRFEDAIDRLLEKVSAAKNYGRVGGGGLGMAESVVVETKFGEIEIELLSDKAPGHVKNFLDLARKGFYDGTTFHRVIPGFMVQGGCPNTKDAKAGKSTHGTGGPGYTIKAEFNDTPHKRGVVSMARAQDPNSAGSQFFICVSDSSFLDRQYSAFGRVVRGMEAADKIVAAPRDGRDNPNERIDMKLRVVAQAG